MGARTWRPINLNQGIAVYERVPAGIRAEMERAIIERPRGLRTISEIYRHFRMHEEYDLSLYAFRAYARRVLHVARGESIGTIARQLSAPAGHLDEALLQKRGHLLLIQQIIRALEDGELSTSELHKLAAAYTAQRRLWQQLERAERGGCAESGEMDPGRVSELIREVYGADVTTGLPAPVAGSESTGKADSDCPDEQRVSNEDGGAPA